MAALASLSVLLAIFWPIRENWREKPRDNFPLSYFPMFSHQRDSIQTLNYLVGYDAAGLRVAIPYDYAGSGGFNQVRRQINKKVRNEKGEKLCEKVAKRLGDSKKAPFCDLVRVDLVRGDYNLDQYFDQGNKAPLAETIIASTQIKRP